MTDMKTEAPMIDNELPNTELSKDDPITGDPGNLENLDDIDIEAAEKDIVDIATPKDGLLKRIFRGVQKTIAGRNKAGKVIGFGLDVFTFFAPAGSKIDNLRQKGKQALNLNKDNNDMKDALKGLVSKEAWKKILVFTDEDGNFSFQESLTTIVQLAAIIGALYAADYFGVLEPLMAIVGLQ